MTSRSTFWSRSASVAAVLALALTGAALPATAEPKAQPALTQQSATNLDNLVGGKSVVGETSPIHDPALIIDDDGTWYVYSTGLLARENGGTIQIWSSHDEGTTWEYTGTVWDRIPAWIDEHFSDGTLPENLWAPEIYENDGTYYLYYSASRFGGNNSLTALATNTTLDPEDPDYEWVDQGLVVESPATGLDPDNPGKTFNAIDAGIIEDADGKPYMSIGSFWYGIFLVPLEWPSGKPVEDWQSRTVNIADRFVPGNPIEAPYIIHRDGYYYLFTSFDFCCRGADSTYKIAVGRSQAITGPYLDKEGRDMFGGGGSILLESHGAMNGVGGQSVFDDYLAFHYYDRSNAYAPTLGLQKMGWEDGWPTVDQSVELPALVTAPRPATVRDGHKASFTASATGTPEPVAVWESSDDDGATWHPADVTQRAERNNGTYTSVAELKKAQASQDGRLFRATFSNPHGTVTTEPVELIVEPKPGKRSS
ncbi:glycoside hydrolase family 43 protein [Arthrobacter burdickii]|uniref:Glycoside hydrolase family 43 protein n=1 Tax=Arthrobacter burdickii TaxID=3035920 RepID=A0ABT8JXP8_9MICC|nr:glycoside hydrolase family 43 protein [Arthrobacter burdickii]MDN4609732.1 glycoside hydrolase family 43 protein [Arthrobacter burdickii]